MNKPFIYMLISALLPLSALADLPVIGWVEDVTVTDHRFRFSAKIDTGADNSSMHVDDYKIIQRSGIDWVSFEFTDKDGEHVRMDRRLEKIIKVKRKLLPAEKRPVIKMFVCIGTKGKMVPVNLVDRNNYKFRFLVGRSYLTDTYLVDSAKKHLTKPNCNSDNN